MPLMHAYLHKHSHTQDCFHAQIYIYSLQLKKKNPIKLVGYCTMSTCATLAHKTAHIHTATTPLTLPAEKVTIGRKMMPSLASGTFAQTAASTAITAPDW